MMEAVSTSETSVNFYQITRRKNPENSHLQNFPDTPKVKLGLHQNPAIGPQYKTMKTNKKTSG
jgi:hypothetical protein